MDNMNTLTNTIKQVLENLARTAVIEAVRANIVFENNIIIAHTLKVVLHSRFDHAYARVISRRFDAQLPTVVSADIDTFHTAVIEAVSALTDIPEDEVVEEFDINPVSDKMREEAIHAALGDYDFLRAERNITHSSLPPSQIAQGEWLRGILYYALPSLISTIARTRVGVADIEGQERS